MSNHEDRERGNPATGPGSTNDPNQANRTGLPRQEEEKPKVPEDRSSPDNPSSGPGSTSDPNQANRT